MNFYTKVLSTHAANERLELSVSFVVPLNAPDAEHREPELRAALRELGLKDEALVQD
jgi:hypothetical protein